MSQNVFPENWVWARIGDLCLPVESVDFSKRILPSFRYIDISSIDRNEKVVARSDLIDYTVAPSRARQVVLKNDVLVSTVRPNLNAVAIVPEYLNNEICSTGFCVLRTDSNILDVDYLFAWVRSSMFIQLLTRAERGIGYPSVSDSDVKNTQFPLPPLPEQRRIAALLRETDEILRLRRRANEKMQEIVQALFYDIFGDPEKNPKGWELSRLSKEGTLDRGRSQHRPRDAAHLYGGSYPFIQTGDVSNSNGLITIYQQTYSEAGLAQSRLWQKGTLCITIAANIARTAILTFDACFPDSIVGFIPGPGITVEYLRQWFVIVQDRLEKFAPHAAQKNINLEVLRNLQVPIPPISLQRKFTSLFNEIYNNIHQQNSSDFLLNNLYQSILSQAFSGELTVAWRQTHAAELARVALERDALLEQLRGTALTAVDTRAVIKTMKGERTELIDELADLQSALLTFVNRQPESYVAASRLHDEIRAHLDEQGQHLSELDQESFYADFARLDCSLDALRRDLHFLAALGLIKEVALSLEDEFGNAHFMTVYRSLRAEDDIQQQDLTLLGDKMVEEGVA